VAEGENEALLYSGQQALAMTPVGPTQCEARWRAVLVSFDEQHTTLLSNNPDATEEITLIRTGLVTIGQLIQNSPQ
jgi:hypothetical protein